jgi:hypothetical protein
MTTESQSTSRPNSRLWLSRRRVFVLFSVLLVGALALFVWYRVASLPDLGEPFDVRTFAAIAIPDDQNAFTYYHQAKDLFVAEPLTVTPGSQQRARFRDNYDEAITKGWSLANQDYRNWLNANGPALDVWRRGTECSKALEIPPADLGPLNLPDCGPPRHLARLSLLEAARVSAERSPAEAWTWYRAALRFSRHAGMHAATLGRLVGIVSHAVTVEAVLRWSGLPQLTAVDLRHALADVLAIDEMTPPVSDNLKAEYLFCLASLEETSAGWTGMPFRLMGYPGHVHGALSLVYANWLSQVDRPRFRRLPAKRRKWELFELDPAAPPNPKVLAPAEIEDRCGLAEQSMQATMVSLLMPSMTNFIDATDRERVRQAALVLGLALELYHREHGQFPAALDDLVKQRYLKSIPANPFGKGEPFHYRREPDSRQGVVLWSVWLDGIDQNGKIDTDRGREDAPGDKIFRIASPR